MKRLRAKEQVRSSEHNNRRKMQELYSIIQNTEFAMAFSTVYSAYMWPVNPFTALTKVHLLQVSKHTNCGQLICKLTPDSSATLLLEPKTSKQPNIIRLHIQLRVLHLSNCMMVLDSICLQHPMAF